MHWPQLSSSKKRIRLSAAPCTLSWSRQDHDRGRADEAAVFLQRAEIERDVVHRRRQDAAGRAARQIGVEGVAVGHAAAIFVDQFAHGDAGRRELHAGILDAARHRIAAQAVAAVAAMALPPVGALLDDVAHPPQRLDIVDQRRQAEQADLERIRRLVPRQAALALDAFEQRGFLAADIGAGAAAHDAASGRPAAALRSRARGFRAQAGYSSRR